GRLRLRKGLVLVEAYVNRRTRGAVFEAVARNFDRAEDFLLIPGVPLDTLDFTSFTMNLGSKMVFDAQTKPGRPPAAPLAEVADPRGIAPEVIAHRLVRGGILIVQVRAEPRGVLERLLARPEYAAVNLIVA